MTRAEIEAFLAEPNHLVRIGTTDDDGLPLVVPTWFTVENGVFLVTPRERSAWFHNLQRDPRVCFTVDEDSGPYRKVVLRGAVTTLFPLGRDDEWRDVYRRITLRYVPETWGDAYLDDTRDEPRALLGLTMAEARVTSWRMPARPGEDPLAVWAPKYYHSPRRAG
jgi:nitroimidazol reductase NimA-like FMN-containing flavoprotein (pyridoxamine 5'-phosphate oxidase superfamily)